MNWAGMACESLDGPAALKYRSFARTGLGPKGVRIAVAAAGVNFPDVLMTKGLYQWKPPLPFIPGFEIAGSVIEVGADVRDISAGAQVMAFVRGGAFATEAVAEAARTFPVPDGFTMAENACLLVAAHTAHYALIDRGALRAGERVLVLGAGGGVGLAAVEIAALLGGEVIAAASSAEKLALAQARGAKHLINYTTQDLREAVKAISPSGVDVVFDPVGGDAFDQAIRVLNWNGRFLVVGFASGRIGTLAANRPLLQGSSLIGVRAGEAGRRNPGRLRESVAEIRAWANAGHLKPHVSQSLPLREASAALVKLEQRAVTGRIALVT